MIIFRKMYKNIKMQPKINKKQLKIGRMQPVSLVRFYQERGNGR